MRRLIAALCVIITAPLLAQEHKPLTLVAATTPGRIQVPVSDQWRPKEIALYDSGTRPVVTLQNAATNMTMSVILFPYETDKLTAETCRKDVLDPILQNLESSATVKNKKMETHPLPSGASLAVGSYLIANLSNLIDSPIQQENFFGFLSSAHTCAEIHLSKANYTSADLPLFNAALDQFTFDADYQPTTMDYTILGSIYYQVAHDYPAAAVYYQRALDTVASDPPHLNQRRYLTDQLSMSYGISGDIKHSRKINEQAIQVDPDYPLYYYNLACSDAEQGKATDARTHLQQAFDRKANTLANEHLPDPATDDSILKLKKNKDFWAFVQTLSPQAKP
jgi:tetratricopeptide (TPR) repeat protein